MLLAVEYSQKNVYMYVIFNSSNTRMYVYVYAVISISGLIAVIP